MTLKEKLAAIAAKKQDGIIKLPSKKCCSFCKTGTAVEEGTISIGSRSFKVAWCEMDRKEFLAGLESIEKESNPRIFTHYNAA